MSILGAVIDAFSSAFSSAFGGGSSQTPQNNAQGGLTMRFSGLATARTRQARDIAGTLKSELTSAQTTLSQLMSMLTTTQQHKTAVTLQSQIKSAQTTLSQLISILPQ